MNERRRHWSFHVDEDEMWHWQMIEPGSAAAGRSHCTFATLAECVDDAARHGYVVYLPHGDRRMAPSDGPLVLTKADNATTPKAS
jgi:hypothetical protein